MRKTAVITARVESDIAEGLSRLATQYDRSRAWLVAKAVTKYVEDESAFLASLKEGEDAIDRGDYLTQEEMGAEVERWRQNRKRPV